MDWVLGFNGVSTPSLSYCKVAHIAIDHIAKPSSSFQVLADQVCDDLIAFLKSLFSSIVAQGDCRKTLRRGKNDSPQRQNAERSERIG